jgi:ankyrin repeat protein
MLQSYLREYFIEVVKLCHHLLRFTNKSILGQMASFQIDSELKARQSGLERWAALIKEEVSLLMAQSIEEQGYRSSALWRSSRLEAHYQRLNTRLRVLDFCSTYEHQKPWKELRKAGNAAFFYQMPEYQCWRAKAESCTLVCTGMLGAGKSVLLANVVDDINLHVQGTNTPVAYFFCTHDNLESLQARTVLCSLARQILSEIPDITMLEEILCKAPRKLDSDGVFDLLRHAVPPSFGTYFILDGLDECEELQRQEILQQLRKLQDAFTLILCVSFRLEADNVLRFDPKKFANPSTMTIPASNPDIDNFISTKLEYCIESGKLTIGDPKLVLEIQDALLNGARGMFLWVILQVQAICSVKEGDEAIRKALSDLPKDLPETFSRILQRSAELGKDYQTRILELVTVACRPLTIEELREALSVVPGNLDPRQLLHDVYSALACCGSLIIVDEEDEMVRLIHHSVKSFLLSEMPGSSKAMLTLDSANKTMRAIIFTYLNYGIFDTQISPAVAPRIMAQATLSKAVRSMEAPHAVRSIALKLLRSRREPKFDMGKILAAESKSFKSRPVSQFAFYNYARSYCLRHTLGISKEETSSYALLHRLLEKNALDLSDGDEVRLFFWAVQKRLDEVVRLLVEKVTDLNSRDPEHGRTPLSLAAQNGDAAVVELLLATGTVEPDSEDDVGRTSLSWAAKDGHQAVVKLLLATGKVEPDHIDKYGRTPLEYAIDNADVAVIKLLLATGRVRSQRLSLHDAARNGHDAMVELLLAIGTADLNSKDECGQTPLSVASENGHASVVKLLLATGRIDLDSMNQTGRTPLVWAAKNGHASVVQLLLATAMVEPDLKDDLGRTSLSWAAKDGHQAVVKLLLATGSVEPDSKDASGRTPLSEAAENGHECVVQLLLATGKVDPDSNYLFGRTPLGGAAENGHETVVKLLLATGRVEPDPKDWYCRTPLSQAAENGHEAVVKLLLATGKVEPDSRDVSGWTPLWRAAKKGHESVVMLLLATGKVELDRKDTLGRTPLAGAVMSGHEAVAKLLLATGKVDPDHKDIFGKTPLWMAVMNGSAAVLELLLATGRVEVDSKDEGGRTPLWWAAWRGHEDVIRLLLATGKVNVDSEDENGRTPRQTSAQNGYKLVEMLLESKL